MQVHKTAIRITNATYVLEWLYFVHNGEILNGNVVITIDKLV